VGALHDEDQVGLFDPFGGAVFLRIGGQAGGRGVDAGVCREHLFGRGGAEAVAGAEEEEVGQMQTAGIMSAYWIESDLECCVKK
tara:strand:- start:46123 stop:46374 length:252 start_codon:yes stop_codon:yes gene_type:complete